MASHRPICFDVDAPRLGRLWLSRLLRLLFVPAIKANSLSSLSRFFSKIRVWSEKNEKRENIPEGHLIKSSFVCPVIIGRNNPRKCWTIAPSPGINIVKLFHRLSLFWFNSVTRLGYFWKVLETYFLKNLARTLGNFFVILKTSLFTWTTVLATFWATVLKIGLFLILPSGHTGSEAWFWVPKHSISIHIIKLLALHKTSWH